MSIPGERDRGTAVWASSAAIALLLFVVLFWHLGTPTFWDPDEAHYAETTRELLESGDWLAPSYNEQPFFDKPILFHWLQAVPMLVAGPDELGARFTPALAALALIALTAWVGRTLISPDVGRLAALLLGTSPAVFALARYAILDTVFTAFLFGGAALVSMSAVQRRPGLQWGGYVLIALAVLTKGPLALVLCGLAFGLSLAASAGLRKRLLELRLASGVAVVVAIAAPWFVYMAFRFRDAFVSGYLLDENLRLYATDRFTPTASSSVWFYFRVLGAGLLPWTGIVVGRLYDDIRRAVRRDAAMDPVDVLLWSWTAAIVGFFTLSKFKLDHYVFPAGPALCLIGARAWMTTRNEPARAENAGTRLGLLLVGPLLIVVSIVGAFMLIARLALPTGALLVPVAVGLAGVVTVVQVNIKRQRPLVPWMVFGALGVTYAGLTIWVLPALEQRKVVPDVARWVATRAAETDHVASFRLNRWNTALRFYVNRHVAMIDAPEEARALFAAGEPFYCVMLRPAYEEFVADGVPLEVVYERDGMWATSGRVLWRSQVPLTRFVVVTRGHTVP